MINNPFKPLADMYDESVCEVDATGVSTLFKEATEKVFEYLNENNYTPYDIEYLDGYYIFGTGTNSVIHFHLKETPGWKYGIWWNTPKDDKTHITGDIFTQYEENIDKFKPSRSEIAQTLSYWPEYLFEDVLLLKKLDYIKNEPELAFCKDYYGWDAYEYHTREDAKREFNKWKREQIEAEAEDLKEQVEEITFMKTKVFPLFENEMCIIDRGSNWWPRFEVLCNLDSSDYIKTKYDITKPGYYGIEDFAEKLRMPEFRHFHDTVYLCDNDTYLKLKDTCSIDLSEKN